MRAGLYMGGRRCMSSETSDCRDGAIHGQRRPLENGKKKGLRRRLTFALALVRLVHPRLEFESSSRRPSLARALLLQPLLQVDHALAIFLARRPRLCRRALEPLRRLAVLVPLARVLVRRLPSLAQVPLRVVQGRLERVDQVALRLEVGFALSKLLLKTRELLL